jgi:hypothetical protein
MAIASKLVSKSTHCFNTIEKRRTIGRAKVLPGFMQSNVREEVS